MNRTNMEALIDGDVLLYRCGFAAQHNKYYVYPDGEEQWVAVFSRKRDASEWVNDREGVIVGHELDVEPFENAAHNINRTIQHILTATGSLRHTVFLSGERNFRDEIATIKPYKGNRDPDHKPHHYDALREFIINNYNAEITDGIEADDAMGIAQYGVYVRAAGESCGFMPTEDMVKADVSTIICTIDKDLDMIPGWHYNFNTGNKYWITEGQAKLNFYKQLLMGDPVDNIPGIKGIGPHNAGKLLNDCKSEEEMMSVVREQWRKFLGKDDVDDVINEVGQLLWIQRNPGEMWHV